jgi:hypothetical protein
MVFVQLIAVGCCRLRLRRGLHGQQIFFFSPLFSEVRIPVCGDGGQPRGHARCDGSLAVIKYKMGTVVCSVVVTAK